MYYSSAELYSDAPGRLPYWEPSQFVNFRKDLEAFKRHREEQLACIRENKNIKGFHIHPFPEYTFFDWEDAYHQALSDQRMLEHSMKKFVGKRYTKIVDMIEKNFNNSDVCNKYLYLDDYVPGGIFEDYEHMIRFIRNRLRKSFAKIKKELYLEAQDKNYHANHALIRAIKSRGF